MERAIADFWGFGAQEANASQTQRGQLVEDEETLDSAMPAPKASTSYSWSVLPVIPAQLNLKLHF